MASASALANAASHPLPRPAPRSQAIAVQADPIWSFGGYGSEDKFFGKLLWVGGLKLSSDHEKFGGFSGLVFLDAQRFIAVGDKGVALSGRLQIEGGKPVGLDETRLRFLPGLSDSVKEWQRDAEGFDVAGNVGYVSFEGDARLMLYALKDGELKRTVREQPLPRSVFNGVAGNKGLEAVAFSPDGTMVLISEQLKGGRIQGWLRKKEGRTKAFTLPEQGELLVTDAAFTTEGDLLILERKFSLLGGLQIRLRRVRAADFKAGDIERLDTLFHGNLAYALDNMEGLAVQAQPDGSNLITMISDDNFNSFQRTLLLQFLLPAGE